MSVFRLTEMNGITLFLMLVFPSAAVTGQTVSFYVRGGDEVRLSCTNVRTDQHECDKTTWYFYQDGRGSTEQLVVDGKISNNEFTKAKAARLSVASDCSLVIKNLRENEDDGLYTCRQFISGQQQGPDAEVYLSLIHLTERQDTDKMMLSCSVSRWRYCREKLVWLFDGEKLTGSNSTVQTSQSHCITTVTFLTTEHSKERFKCEVTDPNGKVQTFGFPPLSSGKTTTTTTTTATPKEMTAGPITTTDPSNSAVLNYVMLAMRVAELFLLTVITALLIRSWKRAAGNQTPPDDNIVLNSVSGRTVQQSGPATSQDEMGDDGDDGAVDYDDIQAPSTSAIVH